EWSSQMLLADSCVVNELVSSVKVEDVSAHHMQNIQNPDGFMVRLFCVQVNGEALAAGIELDEWSSQMLLADSWVVNELVSTDLSQTEERNLKKVRRKIRNKLSTQDSRRRKKEYIDGLESRGVACSAQNKELQRTVDQLEKHNVSLVAQLHSLQALIKQTAIKAAQTSTCIMILIFSLALLIFPSYSPFSRRSPSAEDTYAPAAVISRNILNEAESLPLLEDPGEDDPMSPEPQSEPRPADADADADADGPQQTQDWAREQRNGSAASDADADTDADALSVGLSAPVAAGIADAAKPPHADEM
ncbi:cyclic AMP-responsive element-binding protein 3-like protein 4, partial [Sinocyclocheilus anshuiensis]|uniref:cyclic AMP-responsive element-binding protein 3-like protein 4 n=1 Tax=Sinocyclocheilus anshuiensis TaxID=1608454 RepID=UPI0007B83DFD